MQQERASDDSANPFSNATVRRPSSGISCNTTGAGVACFDSRAGCPPPRSEAVAEAKRSILIECPEIVSVVAKRLHQLEAVERDGPCLSHPASLPHPFIICCALCNGDLEILPMRLNLQAGFLRALGQSHSSWGHLVHPEGLPLRSLKTRGERTCSTAQQRS